jgi:hypothetical protein
MSKRSAKKLVGDSELKAVQAEARAAKVEAARWKRNCKEATAAQDLAVRTVEALTAIPENPAVQEWETPMESEPREVAVVVPATDWHVEEQITAETTNGKNVFNLSEAEARIERYYQKIIRLCKWQNHLAPINAVWHPFLGDLMSGYIHEELAETNALSPTEACLFLQEMICSGIDYLVRETTVPIIIPTCHGNHGRTTQKKRIKSGYANSYEWLLYSTLAKHYRNSNRVFWRVGKGYHNIQEIMGRKVRFHHGDGMRYQGGVGGITIPVNKAIAQWDKVQAVDFDIFGHWHTHLVGYPKWVSCGSLMGYSEYSVEIKAEFQHPTQTFIVIDRDYGLTVAAPIFLTKAGEK